MGVFPFGFVPFRLRHPPYILYNPKSFNANKSESALRRYIRSRRAKLTRKQEQGLGFAFGKVQKLVYVPREENWKTASFRPIWSNPRQMMCFQDSNPLPNPDTSVNPDPARGYRFGTRVHLFHPQTTPELNSTPKLRKRRKNRSARVHSTIDMRTSSIPKLFMAKRQTICRNLISSDSELIFPQMPHNGTKLGYVDRYSSE